MRHGPSDRIVGIVSWCVKNGRYASGSSDLRGPSYTLGSPCQPPGPQFPLGGGGGRTTPERAYPTSTPAMSPPRVAVTAPAPIVVRFQPSPPETWTWY